MIADTEDRCFLAPAVCVLVVLIEVVQLQLLHLSVNRRSQDAGEVLAVSANKLPLRAFSREAFVTGDNAGFSGCVLGCGACCGPGGSPKICSLAGGRSGGSTDGPTAKKTRGGGLAGGRSHARRGYGCDKHHRDNSLAAK